LLISSQGPIQLKKQAGHCCPACASKTRTSYPLRAVLDLRMDLMIAVLKRTTIINIRRADPEDRYALRSAGIRDIYAVPNVQAVASADCIAVIEQAIRAVVQTSLLGAGQNPDTDTIAVCRRLGATRVEPARLTTIFNIHAEDAGAASTIPVGIGPVANTGEYDLISWCSAWLWSRDPVTRIAIASRRICDASIINSTRADVGAQASASQCVIVGCVEVAFQTALIMADVCPAAMDAWIADDVIERYDTVRVANRRADLAAMGNIAHILWADIYALRRIRILPTATGHAASVSRSAGQVDHSLALAFGSDVGAEDVDAAEAACG